MKYDSALTATLVAVRDRVAQPNRPLALAPDERLDGATVLVTGATGGLGAPIARLLAARGARVICSARSRADALVQTIEARGGRALDLPVDLADLRSVDRLVDALDPIDRLVICAGIVPGRSRATEQGFDVMIGVNFLANVRLVDRLVAQGKLVGSRVVIVSSESHRGADHVDFGGLGVADDYGMGGVMKRYGYSKLLLTAWAQELSRRLEPSVAVHTICPGPVESKIAREAPAWAQAVLAPVMRTFFSPPLLAAQPVVYLACSDTLRGRTGVYFHRWREKRPSPLACDEAVAKRLYDMSLELVNTRSAA